MYLNVTVKAYFGNTSKLKTQKAFWKNTIRDKNWLIEDLSSFCKNELTQGNVNKEDIDLIFKLVIVDDKDENKILYQNELKFINGTRQKELKCNVSLIGNILNGIIPFKDLSVGYLGQWSRKPTNYYNFNFLSKILAKQTHTYFNCNVIDL